ncbi:hypothetical protein, partial [Thalassobius sp. I31.1]|uniref:hypothetical protein n=1 Tax=Thalassobius sp. I31.1 TaxID=2109912 RepID=UPI001E4AF77C
IKNKKQKLKKYKPNQNTPGIQIAAQRQEDVSGAVAPAAMPAGQPAPARAAGITMPRRPVRVSRDKTTEPRRIQSGEAQNLRAELLQTADVAQPTPPAPEQGLVEQMRQEIPANDRQPPEQPEPDVTDRSDLALILGNESRVEEVVEAPLIAASEPEIEELPVETELPEVNFDKILSHVVKNVTEKPVEEMVETPEAEGEPEDLELSLDLSLFVDEQNHSEPEPPEADVSEEMMIGNVLTAENDSSEAAAEVIHSEDPPAQSGPLTAAEIWTELTSGAQRPTDVDGVIDAIGRLLQVQSGPAPEDREPADADKMPVGTNTGAKSVSGWDFLT